MIRIAQGHCRRLDRREGQRERRLRVITLAGRAGPATEPGSVR